MTELQRLSREVAEVVEAAGEDLTVAGAIVGAAMGVLTARFGSRTSAAFLYAMADKTVEFGARTG